MPLQRNISFMCNYIHFRSFATHHQALPVIHPCGTMSLSETLKDVKDEDLVKGLQEMSSDDRKKLQEALKILQTNQFEAIARSYSCSASNGDWGDYEMKVLVKKDGTGTVSEARVDFRDSPEVTETWFGSFSLKGDLLTFTGTEIETATSGAGGVHKEPAQACEKKLFHFKTLEDKTLLQVSSKGEEHEMPHRDGKKKILH